MKIKYFLLFGSLFFIGYTFAQSTATEIAIQSIHTEQIKESNEPIISDRPGQGESAFLLSKNIFQLETGLWIENDKNKYTRINKTSYNTSLFRLGISNHLEIRLITEFLGTASYSNDSLIRSVHGLNAVSIGSKIFICEQKGIIPKIALLTHLELPYFGCKEFRPSHMAPKLRFSMDHFFLRIWSVSYNLGVEWDGDSKIPSGVYTVALSSAPIQRFSVFVEGYGYLIKNSYYNQFHDGFTQDHRINGGLIYNVHTNFQIDFSAGVGLSYKSPDTYFSFGFSYKIQD